MFTGGIVRDFIASRRWAEAGNIGFSFLNAPHWYLQAMALYDTEAGRAMRFKQKEDAAKSKGSSKRR